MNQLNYGLLRALLITFGIINVIGIVWYSNMLSIITLVCGLTACIAAFSLGSVNVTKIQTAFGRLALTSLGVAGLVASAVRIIKDSNYLLDLWGAIPHILSLVLFVFALKAVLRKDKQLKLK